MQILSVFGQDVRTGLLEGPFKQLEVFEKARPLAFCTIHRSASWHAAVRTWGDFVRSKGYGSSFNGVLEFTRWMFERIMLDASLSGAELQDVAHETSDLLQVPHLRGTELVAALEPESARSALIETLDALYELCEARLSKESSPVEEPLRTPSLRVGPTEPSDASGVPEEEQSTGPSLPAAIMDSLRRFRADHPNPERVAFLMMKFGTTPAHSKIQEAVSSALARHDIQALRADSKQYHEDLFPNVQTYMHGCGFGIAVFERLEADDFNPNVALEVGYLLAQGKPVCLLKDKTVRLLQADLFGKLYREFDPQDPRGTIPKKVEAWLKDVGLI